MSFYISIIFRFITCTKLFIRESNSLVNYRIKSISVSTCSVRNSGCFVRKGEKFRNFEQTIRAFKQLSNFSTPLLQHWLGCFVNPIPWRFHLNFPEGRLVPGICNPLPSISLLSYGRDLVRLKLENGSNICKKKKTRSINKEIIASANCQLRRV